VVNVEVLGCILKATTKNSRQLFRGKKVHPAEKNPGYASAAVHCFCFVPYLVRATTFFLS